MSELASGRYQRMIIDVAFDFRTDAGGRDPDAYSPALRSYHQLLWSKPLPGGEYFVLSDTTPGVYLHHLSELGEFFLTSDSVAQTFTRWKSLRHITEQVPESANESFRTISYTIGGMMVFPGNKIDSKMTINVARGLNRSIADRIDLTMECIRRYYLDVESPLSVTLARYGDFFALFGDFVGYVNFFLLQDLIADDIREKFFIPFDGFQSNSTPADVESFNEFRHNSIEFLEARNNRIGAWCAAESQET